MARAPRNSIRRTLRRAAGPGRVGPYGTTAARGTTVGRPGMGAVAKFGRLGRAANMLSRRLPYVGAALTAYDLGKGAIEMFSRKSTKSNGPNGGSGPGKYSGKFKKTKKIKNSAKLNYANKGIYMTSETHGTLEDPNCVYLSHVAIDGFELIQVMGEALIRKLFEKAGFSITNIDNRLISTSISTAVDWRVQMTQVNKLTGIEADLETHDLLANDSVRSVADIFRDKWLSYSSGFNNTGVGNGAVDTLHPHRFILYRQDFNTSRGLVFECEVRFDEEIMCVKGGSHIKIQNRTVAASSSTDADDVSNNPIIGRRYTFSSTPKLRDRSGHPLEQMPINNGVQLVRAGEMVSGSTTYNEPPLPTMFTNCKASSKLYLGPGDIKSGYIAYKKHMSFLKFLEVLRLQYGAAPDFNIYTTIFPCEMYAMEDMINVNTLHNIRVAYEANKTIGVYFKTRKKARAVTVYQTRTVNNIPP